MAKWFTRSAQISQYKRLPMVLKKAFWAIVVLSCSWFAGTAQPWQKFSLTEEGDTLNRIDLNGLRQGAWLVRVDPLRGEPGYEEEGEYVDGKKEGVWKRYTPEGDLIAVERFMQGYKNGLQTYFTRIGEPLREEHWKYVDPRNPYDTIDVPDFDNPMLTKSKIIKLDAAEVRHGEWRYFDPSSGRVVKTEHYISGQKLNVSGRPVADKERETKTAAGDAERKPAVKPKAVEEWEKKNQGKKKVTVRDGRTGG
jgi:hypothetical protein